jgi:glutamine phosphoribosylpyrophosphate amidotransferase
MAFFPIRYGFFRPLLWVTGAGPRASGVTIEDGRLRVRMGWMFRADVPLASVAGAAPHSGMVGGIGVHGARGTWLVNGGIRGVVRIFIDPPDRARVLGVRVKLKELQVSVESPEALLDALSGLPRSPRA